MEKNKEIAGVREEDVIIYLPSYLIWQTQFIKTNHN